MLIRVNIIFIIILLRVINIFSFKWIKKYQINRYCTKIYLNVKNYDIKTIDIMIIKYLNKFIEKSHGEKNVKKTNNNI